MIQIWHFLAQLISLGPKQSGIQVYGQPITYFGGVSDPGGIGGSRQGLFQLCVCWVRQTSSMLLYGSILETLFAY